MRRRLRHDWRHRSASDRRGWRGLDETPLERPSFWPKRSRWRIAVAARPFLLLAVLLLLWSGFDPALVEPFGPLATEPETVDRHFSRCGPGSGAACVVDGDTFRLGARRIRIIGIDAPEVHARCPAEARLAEAATVRLQQLLNAGPFEMVGRIDDMTDRYGRELRALRRTAPKETTVSIADEMRSAGLARRYLGGWRAGWC
jgi:endonuclease YncB( thermonuclease family)